MFLFYPVRFQALCVRFYPHCVEDLFRHMAKKWFIGKSLFHIWYPWCGKCHIVIEQDDGFRKAFEPAFSHFRRSKETNVAYSTYLKVLNIFRAGSSTCVWFLRFFFLFFFLLSRVMSWISALAMRWTSGFKKIKTSVPTGIGNRNKNLV